MDEFYSVVEPFDRMECNVNADVQALQNYKATTNEITEIHSNVQRFIKTITQLERSDAYPGASLQIFKYLENSIVQGKHGIHQTKIKLTYIILD